MDQLIKIGRSMFNKGNSGASQSSGDSGFGLGDALGVLSQIDKNQDGKINLYSSFFLASKQLLLLTIIFIKYRENNRGGFRVAHSFVQLGTHGRSTCQNGFCPSRHEQEWYVLIAF